MEWDNYTGDIEVIDAELGTDGHIEVEVQCPCCGETFEVTVCV